MPKKFNQKINVCRKQHFCRSSEPRKGRHACYTGISIMHTHVSSKHFLVHGRIFFKKKNRACTRSLSPSPRFISTPPLLKLDGLPLKTLNNNYITSNANRTGWSLIRFVIIRVIIGSLRNRTPVRLGTAE